MTGTSTWPSCLVRPPISAFATATATARSARSHCSAPARDSPPTSIAVGDVTGDGIADAVVGTSVAVYVLVFRGAGDRAIVTLGPYGTGASMSSIALGRFNNDAFPDLAVADMVAPCGVVVMFGDGAGAFGPPTSYALPAEPRSIAAADFDSDGHHDIVVALPSLNEARVLFNDGVGLFVNPRSVPTSLQPVHVAAGDSNGDGRPELIVTNNTYSGPAAATTSRWSWRAAARRRRTS